MTTNSSMTVLMAAPDARLEKHGHHTETPLLDQRGRADRLHQRSTGRLREAA